MNDEGGRSTYVLTAERNTDIKKFIEEKPLLVQVK